MEDLDNYFQQQGWSIALDETRPAVAGRFQSGKDLSLSAPAKMLLDAYPDGIYHHQHEAIRLFLKGQSVAITTPTASGKTLVFNACAADLLANGESVVLAIYPLKALANEQTARWQQAMRDAGLSVEIGRIDGSVPTSARPEMMKKCRIIIMTPDVVHAWLLRKLSQREVRSFLERLSLVVLDEAHTYTSIFGSNSAYVFRRLAHASQILGSKFRYIAASATMDQPLRHLEHLTGETFAEIGEALDSASRADVRTILVRPANPADSLSALGDLIAHVVDNTSHRLIAFVDSRKLAENAATIAGRDGDTSDDHVEISDDDLLKKILPSRKVLPYRSGYDEADRTRIQRRLQSGHLQAVVSTSALELGIDIPGLTLCVMYGVPTSGSSFRQRFGRVGRRDPGLVIVIDDGSARSDAVFRQPASIWSLPLTRSSLYLHNRQVQYMHAMCIASVGGEDEIACKQTAIASGNFNRTSLFPNDFVELCQQEANGEIGNDLIQLKMQGGDCPQLAFPIRDLGPQFKICMRNGPDEATLGTLSYPQLMREAYPGAVYFHQTRAYRVTRVSMHNRRVDVRAEKRYFTSPVRLPAQIFPNLTAGSVLSDVTHGDLRFTECSLHIRESVVGYKERRGSNEIDQSYPLDRRLGLFFDESYFNRTIITSGVIFTHPALSWPDVEIGALGDVILEAFFMEVPFDRQDIGAGSGKIRLSVDGLEKDDRFLCLFDQQNGSLRLSHTVTAPEVLRRVLARAQDMANSASTALSDLTRDVLDELVNESIKPQKARQAASQSLGSESFEVVILPGSSGVDQTRDNMEFRVESIYFHRKLGLCYRGIHVADEHRAQGRYGNGAAISIVPVKNIEPMHGETKIGWYDLDLGEIRETMKGEI